MSDTLRTPLFSRYEVLGEIGEGGWGTVYKARHKVMGRLVALKVLPPSFRKDAESVERFKREAMVLARFDHPNIARIYDADIEQSLPYLAMELVEGQDLQKVLAEKRRLSIDATIRLGAELAEALDHVHRAGIVHRDIKPSNIIVRPDGQAVLTDFGIAFTAALPRITREVPGTPEYMSPEQIDGGTVDGLSDLYSLGVVLYKCLAGQEPFRREGDNLTALNALLQLILEHEAPPLHTQWPAIPAWLGAVVHRAIAKTPADRFPDGHALAEALKAGAAGAAAPTAEPAAPPLPLTTPEPEPEPVPEPVADAAPVTDPDDPAPPPPEPTAEAPSAPPLPLDAEDAEESTLEPEPEPALEQREEPSLEPEAAASEPGIEPQAEATPEPEAPSEVEPSPEPEAASEPEIAPALEPQPEPAEARSFPRAAVLVGVFAGLLLVLGGIGYAMGWFAPGTEPPDPIMLADSLTVDSLALDPFDLPDDSTLTAAAEDSLAALTLRSDSTTAPDTATVPEPVLVVTADSAAEPPKPVDPPTPPVRQPVTVRQMALNTLLTRARSAYQKRDYAGALPFLREAERRGAAEAQYVLGTMYDSGRGVQASATEALQRYRAAAAQGHTAAQYTLAVKYRRGQGVPQSDAEAVAWLQQAAEGGHREAQANLGALYEQGQGVSKSERQAAAWYEKAARQGHASAQYNLGLMYRDGRGTKKSYEDAAALFTRAAEQGHANAQFALGRMYFRGWGVPQSDAEALTWYGRAAKQGHKQAQSAYQRMTGAQ